MKVVMTSDRGVEGKNVKAGETVDCSDSVAKYLLATGMAKAAGSTIKDKLGKK